MQTHTTYSLAAAILSRLQSCLGLAFAMGALALVPVVHAQSAGGTLTGTVIDSSTGKVLEGAEASVDWPAAVRLDRFSHKIHAGICKFHPVSSDEFRQNSSQHLSDRSTRDQVASLFPSSDRPPRDGLGHVPEKHTLP